MKVKQKFDLERAFTKDLQKIITAFKQGNSDPLDGDEAERLAEILHAKIDYNEGNITEDEYLFRLCRNRPKKAVVSMPKRFIVRGKKLTAKQWKEQVKNQLEKVLKYDEEIAWENDSIIQGEGSNEYYVYYTLHIGRG